MIFIYLLLFSTSLFQGEDARHLIKRDARRSSSSPRLQETRNTAMRYDHQREMNIVKSAMRALLGRRAAMSSPLLDPQMFEDQEASSTERVRVENPWQQDAAADSKPYYAMDVVFRDYEAAGGSGDSAEPARPTGEHYKNYEYEKEIIAPDVAKRPRAIVRLLLVYEGGDVEKPKRLQVLPDIKVSDDVDAV